MPFGLDIKSLIVGIILALFVLPWVQSLLFSHANTRVARTDG